MHWAIKYRPRNWENIVGQEPALKTLRATLRHDHIARAYLLEGERGIGKTSLAYLYARALMCQDRIDENPCGNCSSCLASLQDHPDFTVLDSTSLGGINDVRERVLGSMNYEPILGRYRVYVIDEAHGLTAAGANALLATVEDPPPNTVFFFCTTQPEKMMPTLRDRCWRIHLEPGERSNVIHHLRYICDQEGVCADEDVLKLIADHSAGSYRQATLTLESMWEAFGDDISSTNVRDHLGLPPSQAIRDWLERVRDKDWNGSLHALRSLRGYSPHRTLRLILNELPLDGPEDTVFYRNMSEIVISAHRRLRNGLDAGTVLQMLTLEAMEVTEPSHQLSE
jgi:DNA polymerase-3 subunit gamma/tau